MTALTWLVALLILIQLVDVIADLWRRHWRRRYLAARAEAARASRSADAWATSSRYWESRFHWAWNRLNGTRPKGPAPVPSDATTATMPAVDPAAGPPAPQWKDHVT